MRIVRFISLSALVSISLAAGIAVALRLTRPGPGSGVGLSKAAVTPADSARTNPFQPVRQSASLPGNSSQDNILQLPQASSDFVGYWGGYIHSSIQRFSPNLGGTSPDRVSVVFGRQGDIIFMAGELYSSPHQRIVHGPKARVIDARLALVDYESADNDFDYICSHRFRLNGALSISYRSTVGVYDRNSHRLLGIVTERATLKRLQTRGEQLEFARPAASEIPRAEIVAHGTLAQH
jgi:hypothetical protein